MYYDHGSDKGIGKCLQWQHFKYTSCLILKKLQNPIQVRTKGCDLPTKIFLIFLDCAMLSFAINQQDQMVANNR